VAELTETSPARSEGNDGLARILDLGLAVTVVAAPLPYGSVPPAGRAVLEALSFALLLVWLLRALRRPTPLPPLSLRIGVLGLLTLTALQAAPLGRGPLSLLSPRSLQMRDASRPPAEAAAAEARVLGADPASFDRKPALSLDPEATASALRTGAMLAALLLVAVTVAATRGVRWLCAALLLAAAFQGLYGLLVLASGQPQIWFEPKVHYLDSATGTFVNRNHFAAFLAASLPAGLALTLTAWRRMRRTGSGRQHLLELFGARGSRTILLSLLVAIGAAGLLLSLSRAGIALGLAALVTTAFAVRRRGLGRRLVPVLLVLALALIPLLTIGVEPLLDRYARTPIEFSIEKGTRATVWSDTLSMALAYPVFGTGIGTFATAYPMFRSPSVRTRFDHAHNDLIQIAAEGGLLALIALALVLGPVARSIGRALAGQSGALAAGLAAGLCALVFHGLVDFPFHIPSNAALAAVLAGALLGLPWIERT
jgi:O-antigen ligase